MLYIGGMSNSATKGGNMRTYFVDRIDDESSEQLSETIEARHDTHALAIARDIVSERGWDAAEVWDKDADQYVGEARK